jgi:PAS domain S-box-containing protein
MLQEFRLRIGVKLFILLAGLICLAIVPLGYVVFSAVSYFGTYTAEVNRVQITSQARSYLATIAREQAHKFDEFFSHVEVASSIMAAQAVEVYDNIDYYAGFPRRRLELKKSSLNGIYYTSPDEDVITGFWGEEDIPEQTMLEIQALSRLDPVFKGAKKEIPESLATHMLTVSGIYRYLSYVQLNKNAAYSVVSAAEYDMRNSEYLAIFSRPDTPPLRTLWTQAYWDDTSGSLMITAASPVIDKEGILRAATGIDIPLAGILEDLLDGDARRYGEQMSETLFAFLLDEFGKIIAFPQDYTDLFGIEFDSEASGEAGRVFDYALSDSSRVEIQSIAHLLLGDSDEVVEVQLGAERYILNQHSLHKLSWHLVLVTREKLLISSVERTEQALSGTIDLLKKKFLANTLFFIAIIVVVVFFAVKYFVAPLRRLTEASLRVGSGDLKTRCYLNRNDELGILASSFNDMVRQLELAEKVKASQARQLELTVEERTRDLRNKNFVLRDVIAELNAESERRKVAVQALAKSEEQIRVAMDASLAGLGIVQDMEIKYVNPMALRIFGYSLEEMVGGQLKVTDLVVPEERQRLRLDYIGVFRERTDRQIVISCIRKDGSIFDALVGGAITTWKGTQAVVATLMDISEQRLTEEKLWKSTLQLQDSLAEKEVLLREIYHRTKNNMLVIISMLNLQAMDIDDLRVKALFQETENRIRAMSLVHEKLYQSQNLAEVDLGSYLKEMVTALVKTMVIGDRIRVDIECEKVAVSLDNIVPLGLAVNEIVTNSLKHAFPDDREGRIAVQLTRNAQAQVELQIGDDGIGLPAEIDIHKIRSFGMQITVNLIEKQLRGTLEIMRSGGTVYSIRFEEPVRPKRI